MGVESHITAAPGTLGAPYLLFGMGNRPKMVYRQGILSGLSPAGTICSWDVRSEEIDPAGYTVRLVTRAGKPVTISEDEQGVFVQENGDRAAICTSTVRLPGFEGHANADLLRITHHEILWNIAEGVPLPNLLVYRKPWLRDAAMVALALQRTGNLDLIRGWIQNLADPFDRNNAGHEEPDNLGQALYLASLAGGGSHPLVKAVHEALPRFLKDGCLVGPTDFQPHPVYQMKWLKFGLRSLGLDDPYEIPRVPDSYSSLFWMDFREAHVPGPGFAAEERERYPYLHWADAHFHNTPVRQLLPAAGGAWSYPVSCESHASQADYQGIAALDPTLTHARKATPHSWHAAEMFLYLLEAA